MVSSSLRSPFLRFFGPALGLAAFGAPAPAAPAEPLEEVVVTASLRPVAQRETPVSATVLTEPTLRAAGVQHLQDVLSLVPDLNWASGSSRPRYFQLRGIGETDQWQGAPNNSVGFLVDGMDFSGVGMPGQLLDLAQVEVLRGPQGTTLGANALAGLINLRSNAATPAPALRLEATGGGLGTQALGAVAGGALGEDGAAWRAVAQRFRSDGSRRNVTLGRDDTNGLDERLLRLRLAGPQGGAWRTDLAVLWSEQDNGFDAFALDNSRTTRSDKPGRDSQRSRGLALTLEREGAVRFVSTSAVADADIVYSFDGDWGADPSYDFTSRFLRRHRAVTQDLRLLGGAPGEGLGWVAGLYASRVDESNDQLDLYGGDVYCALVSDYRARTLAAYGSVERRIAARWQARLGLRAERRSIAYTDTDGTDLGPAEDMWGGQLTLEYRPGPDGFGYLTWAREIGRAHV